MNSRGRVLIREVFVNKDGYDRVGQFHGEHHWPLFAYVIGNQCTEQFTRAHNRKQVRATVLKRRPWVWFPIGGERANPVREVLRRVQAYGNFAGRTWKLAPGHYPTTGRGKQFYSKERKQELFDESEHTKRVLLDGDYEFTYFWEEWSTAPNEYCWGLQVGPVYYGIRYKDDEVFRTQSPKQLLKAWKEKAWLSQCA